MSFRDWWRNKSGQSKTITVLCSILILDIGLCFATPSALNWVQSAFQLRRADPLEGISYMLIQAVFCILLLVAIGCIAIFWHPGINSPRRNKEKP